MVNGLRLTIDKKINYRKVINPFIQTEKSGKLSAIEKQMANDYIEASSDEDEDDGKNNDDNFIYD